MLRLCGPCEPTIFTQSGLNRAIERPATALREAAIERIVVAGRPRSDDAGRDVVRYDNMQQVGRRYKALRSAEQPAGQEWRSTSSRDLAQSSQGEPSTGHHSRFAPGAQRLDQQGAGRRSSSAS